MNPKVRTLVHKKTGGHCWYCGAALALLTSWEVEHQIPLSRGGSNELYNLVPSCVTCNRSKGILTAAEYRRDLVSKNPEHDLPPFYGRQLIDAAWFSVLGCSFLEALQ